jgi:biotin carboxylase
MVRDHGIEFIGPLPDQITKMGDKSTARDTMKAAGVPTVPGKRRAHEEWSGIVHSYGPTPFE